MKKTSKFILAVAMATMVFAASAQQGQRQRPQRPSPEEMLEAFTEKLDLTDEQVVAWQGIHEKYAEDMKDDPRKTMPKIEAEIQEILSDEQWEKFEKMKPSKGPRGRGRD